MLHLPAVWNDINLGLYSHWAASGDAGAGRVDAALFFAEFAIYAAPLLLVWGWLRRPESQRLPLLQAAVAALLALGLNQIVGLMIFEPRPFAVGLGPALLAHATDSGLPSDHLTVMWAVAFSLLLTPAWRPAGLALALIGLPMAWARVYLGVHWPLDMAAAALSALVAALAVHAVRGLLLQPAMPMLGRLYRKLFAPAIRQGWALR